MQIHSGLCCCHGYHTGSCAICRACVASTTAALLQVAQRGFNTSRRCPLLTKSSTWELAWVSSWLTVSHICGQSLGTGEHLKMPIERPSLPCLPRTPSPGFQDDKQNKRSTTTSASVAPSPLCFAALLSQSPAQCNHQEKHACPLAGRLLGFGISKGALGSGHFTHARLLTEKWQRHGMSWGVNAHHGSRTSTAERQHQRLFAYDLSSGNNMNCLGFVRGSKVLGSLDLLQSRLHSLNHRLLVVVTIPLTQTVWHHCLARLPK